MNQNAKPGRVKNPADTTEISQVYSSRLNPLPILRRLAEKLLRDNKTWPSEEQDSLLSEEAQHSIQELKIHQIELEMQNDELRRTHIELELAKERYFDLYNLAPVGYCTVCKKGLILETNLTSANLLGVGRAELPNQLFSHFIFNEDQDIFYRLRKRLFETEEPQSGELRLVRQDGSSFWVNLEATVRQNGNDTIVSRIVLSSIDKRKLAEEALHKVDRQNQAILDSITDAFISLSEDMVINYFNAEAEKILDRKRIEVVGRNLFDVFPEGKGTIFEDNCTEVIRTQAPKLFDFKVNVASSLTWCGVRVYPSLDGITVSLREVTERKKMEAEKEMRQTVKRQLHKAESLERMAGAVAHLFNNQLQVALGNLEIALDGLADDAVQRKYLNNAIQANRRSADVTGLLLTYLGQTTSKLEALDLSKICQQSLSEIQTALPSGITMETHLKSPGPVVLANASQIQQVLSILTTNAWDAIGDRTGEVTVVIKTLPVSSLPSFHFSNIEQSAISGYFACLEVKDTGCGMPKQTMDRIFDPFYSTKFTGRGLGLAVAMSLVRAWGGMIYVESEVNEGSCFMACLPLAIDVFPQHVAPMTKPKNFKAEGAVLLVDDEPVLCDIMGSMLEHLGFTVFIANSGNEAVALFQKHHDSIVCLLTDLSMPEMDGWETLAALRKIKPDLPAILSSGYDEAHVMDGDYKELPQAFLHKPYTKDELKNTLDHVLAEAASGSLLKQEGSY